MSLYAPGTFATQLEKECATKTGFAFYDLYSGNPNSAETESAYINCVKGGNESEKAGKYLRDKFSGCCSFILWLIVIVAVIVLIQKLK